MSASRAGALAVVAAAVLSAGCSLFTPVKTETTTYVVDKVPAGLRAEPARQVGLSVQAVQAAPLHATRRMVYSTQPHQVGHFNDSEWALPPARMIEPLLVETLRRTGRFSDVASPSEPARGLFLLRSELVEFTQDFTSQPATFRLRMRFSIEGATGRQVVATRELSQNEPLREATARAGVDAANEATEKLLRELAVFAVDHTNAGIP